MLASQLNRIQSAIQIGNKLDQQVTMESVTAWMETNAVNLQFKGNGVFRVPSIYASGLGDYRKDLGYPIGSVMVEYNDYTLAYDRGRSYMIDSADADEGTFISNVSAVMSEINRDYFIPEIDAARFARLAEVATANSNVESGYTPAAGTIYTKIVDAMYDLEEKGYTELVCHISAAALSQLALSTEMSHVLSMENFEAGRVYTKVRFLDDMPLIKTPQNRFYTAIDLLDGVSEDETQGGYQKASTGKDINFMIVGRKVPAAIKKHDVKKIVAPSDNQRADAWLIQERVYHDLLVLENKKDGVYMNTK